MNRKKLNLVIGIVMLLTAVAFNLWLYRTEPTAKIDPNDNAFQFALVDRTNRVWDFAAKTCPDNLSRITCHISLLIDHWVPNWNEGYNLPYYYSHLPQIVIVASYRLISSVSQIFGSSFISLFTYYHWVIYLLLCIFPLSVFGGLRKVGLPWLAAGFGSLLAAQISTDGLYGLDPPSFLWRGYGLSSQLFAMVFLPLAIAYSFKYFQNSKRLGSFGFKILNLFRISGFWPAVFFLFATTAGHLGIGMMAMLSLFVLAVSEPIFLFLNHEPLKVVLALVKENMARLMLLSVVTIFFLSYWIIPVFLNDNYHNISFWDPVWKFNSYGAKETIIRFLNGDLFDFGRLPVFTILVLLGLVASLLPENSEGSDSKKNQKPIAPDSERLNLDSSDILNIPFVHYFPFALLGIFWLLMYFGRTTWGGLLDLIPGMKEFHLSRFIVGLHIAGLFLAPIGFTWIINTMLHLFAAALTKYQKLKTQSSIPWIIGLSVYLFIGLVILIPIYTQTIKYNDLNNKLIVQGNNNFDKVKPDVDTLFATLRALPPGRIYSGRAGWGHDFRVAETSYYMHLSTYGWPTVMWMPETWSPNADTEQYFSEDKAADYDLYNIKYVLTPPNFPSQTFWKYLKSSPTWTLYEVKTNGYIGAGVRPAVVSVNKRSFINAVRLWIQSDMPKKGLYPELTFDTGYPKTTGLPNFAMLDEVTYKIPDQSLHNIFENIPVYMAGTPKLRITSQSETDDMVFKASASVDNNCTECLIVLRQTYHPNWQVTIDGKPVKAIAVFPFFTAIPLTSEGTHEIVFSYQPSMLKVLLITIEGATLILLLGLAFRSRRSSL